MGLLRGRPAVACLAALLFFGGSALAAVATAPPAAALTPVTVTLTSNRNPVPYRQFLAVTVTVSASGGGSPTGTVDFHIGPSSMDTVTLDGNGQASAQGIWANLVGEFAVTASYSGDSSFDPGVSEPLIIVSVKAPTTTTVAAVPSPTMYGDPVTFTATVAAPGLGHGPTGSVAFFHVHGDTRTWLGTEPLVVGTDTRVGSHASVETAALPGGEDGVQAVYRGDPTFLTSTGGTLQSVTPLPTTMTLRTSDNPAVVGTPVTFTARVRRVDLGSVKPTGTVAFFRVLPDDTRRWIANVRLVDGVAAMTTTDLPLGATRVASVYRGGTNFVSSGTARNQRMTRWEGLERRRERGRSDRASCDPALPDLPWARYPVSAHSG